MPDSIVPLTAKPHDLYAYTCLFWSVSWHFYRQWFFLGNVISQKTASLFSWLSNKSAVKMSVLILQGIKEVPRHACHLCGKLFLRGERLTLHLKTVHNFKWPSGHRRFRFESLPFSSSSCRVALKYICTNVVCLTFSFSSPFIGQIWDEVSTRQECIQSVSCFKYCLFLQVQGKWRWFSEIANYSLRKYRADGGNHGQQRQRYHCRIFKKKKKREIFDEIIFFFFRPRSWKWGDLFVVMQSRGVDTDKRPCFCRHLVLTNALVLFFREKVGEGRSTDDSPCRTNKTLDSFWQIKRKFRKHSKQDAQSRRGRSNSGKVCVAQCLLLLQIIDGRCPGNFVSIEIVCL